MWYVPQQPRKTHEKRTESQLSKTVANRRKRAYTAANIEAFGQVNSQIQSIPKLNVEGSTPFTRFGAMLRSGSQSIVFSSKYVIITLTPMTLLRACFRNPMHPNAVFHAVTDDIAADMPNRVNRTPHSFEQRLGLRWGPRESGSSPPPDR